MPNIGTFVVEGEAQWAKLFDHNVDMGFEDAWADYGGQYTVDLVIDEANLEIYEQSKAAGNAAPAYWNSEKEIYEKNRKSKEGHKNEPTDKFIVKFKRKVNDPVAAELGGQPAIIGLPEGETTIGNGTKMKVKFSTYTTKMSNGCRMEAVKITDFKKFEADGVPPVADTDDLPF